MRTTIRSFALLAVCVAVLGCGNNKKPKAENKKQILEQLVDQSTEGYYQLATSIEKGGMSEVDASFSKLTSISKQVRILTPELTKAEDEEMYKYAEKMTPAMKRVMDALKKAPTSGKFSQSEIQEIHQKLTVLFDKF